MFALANPVRNALVAKSGKIYGLYYDILYGTADGLRTTVTGYKMELYKERYPWAWDAYKRRLLAPGGKIAGPMRSTRTFYLPVVRVPLIGEPDDVATGHAHKNVEGAVREAQYMAMREWEREQRAQKHGLPAAFENPAGGLMALAVGAAIITVGAVAYAAYSSSKSSPNPPAPAPNAGQTNFTKGYRYQLTVHSSQPLPQVAQGAPLTSWWQSQLDGITGPGAFQIVTANQTGTQDVVVTADCLDTMTWAGTSPVSFTLTPVWSISVAVTSLGPTPPVQAS